MTNEKARSHAPFSIQRRQNSRPALHEKLVTPTASDLEESLMSSVWSGHLHFGLVVMPVRLLVAARTKTTSLSAFCPPLSTNQPDLARMRTNESEIEISLKSNESQAVRRKDWRRGSESNRRIKVLQTSPLPLGYRALGVSEAAFRHRKPSPTARVDTNT